jgi:hypothetical protein
MQIDHGTADRQALPIELQLKSETTRLARIKLFNLIVKFWQWFCTDEIACISVSCKIVLCGTELSGILSLILPEYNFR